jgi:hypothetical protein
VSLIGVPTLQSKIRRGELRNTNPSAQICLFLRKSAFKDFYPPAKISRFSMIFDTYNQGKHKENKGINLENKGKHKNIIF